MSENRQPVPETMNDRITVLIADDHALLRTGVVSVLSLNRKIKIVGEAENGKNAVEMALRLKPDVVLMDIGMPVLNGMEATDLLKRHAPGMKVVILSGHDDDRYVDRVVRSGAKGYVLKSSPPEELFAAIETVHSGHTFFSSSLSVKSGMKGAYRPPGERSGTGTPGGGTLTSREREVLQRIAEGESHQQIADRLFISVRTVDTHVNNMMKKLNLHATAGLVTYAIKNRIVILKQ